MEIGGEYMQYGVDISTYKRLENKKNKKELRLNGTGVSAIAAFLMGFLLSRVLLSVTIDMGIAPFGIAYLIGIRKEKGRDMLLSLLGIIGGYLSIYKTLEGSIAYCIVAIVVMLYIEICNKIELKQRDIITFGLIFSTFFIYNLIVNNQPIGVNLTFSALKVLSIIPVRYILNYALNCVDELESNYFFST